jgi:hypothetical protein
MRPRDQIIQLHPWINPDLFPKIIEAYCQVAYVYDTDSLFAIVKPVPRDADYLDIVSPLVSFPKSECDCYYIPMCAGSMRLLFCQSEWNLPWTCFSRLSQAGRETLTKKDLHFYKTSKIRALLKR